MKKILLASTALFATAGASYADGHLGMSVSGSAAIGIWGGSGVETQLVTDVDVGFSGAGETDGGLAFGFSIDLDEGGNGQPFEDPLQQGGETIFVSGNFGKLTWGDTDGAFDWALTEVGIGGSIADTHTSHAGYSGNSGLDGSYDGQIVRYEYAFSSFSFAASVEMDDDINTGVAGDGLTADVIFGIGGKFNASLGAVDLGVGLGYQSDGNSDIIGLSLDTTFSNGLQAILNYSDLDGAGGVDSHLGLGVGYTAGAITVGFNYGTFEFTGGGDVTGWGLAADYDLGGGAVMQFGYSTDDSAGDPNLFSLGLAMSF